MHVQCKANRTTGATAQRDAITSERKRINYQISSKQSCPLKSNGPKGRTLLRQGKQHLLLSVVIQPNENLRTTKTPIQHHHSSLTSSPLGYSHHMPHPNAYPNTPNHLPLFTASIAVPMLLPRRTAATVLQIPEDTLPQQTHKNRIS